MAADGLAIYPSLRNRVVLITGGASGIGAAHVESFCRQGAKVAFVDIDEAAGEAFSERLGGQGRARPFFRPVDLVDIPALQGAVHEVSEALGPIAVLVNNAANDQRHRIEEVTVEYWDERLAVNLRHQFFAAQAVWPIMRAAGGGSIINFGSVSWHRKTGGMPAYTTAKAGVEGLTRSLARDLGADRIRVNCVIPGWIMTERQLRLWLTPEAEADLLKAQCLKEKLVPQDVANLVLWLAADDSRMCSGQNFVVDGGLI
ncbi:MAG: SDR family NAD(P)-dependent oxidoreductase [Rhodospirillales bacterium]|nr:SDR family NAD(P)-dependent oxidoreductase [Rhodospirillales bacterium]